MRFAQNSTNTSFTHTLSWSLRDMTQLDSHYIRSITRLRQLLQPAWKIERIRCHEKLVALQTEVTASLANGRVQSAKARSIDYISEYPGERAGYTVLAKVLEAAGDHENATQCFTARLPVELQNELFGTDFQPASSDPTSFRTLKGHSPERCAVQSPWSEHSSALQRFKEDTLVANETHTLVVEQGYLWHDGLNSVPFDRNKQPIMQDVYGCVAPVVINTTARSPLVVKGDVVLLGAPGTNNYFHWMTDILPKLAVLERCGVMWDKNTRFVFRNVSNSFHRRTLKILGIDKSQWIQTLKGHEYISANRIIVPRLNNKMCLEMGSWVPTYLQHSFLPQSDTSKIRRKLFISRDTATSQGRGIGNATEVNKYFSAIGYEIFYPEQHTIVEQAKAFADASHIAAPHGAGLTNLHFCKPGTRVWEFHGAHFSPCYWALSEKMGLIYRNLSCTEVSQSDPSRLDQAKTLDSRRGKGFTIPIDQLPDLIM